MPNADSNGQPRSWFIAAGQGGRLWPDFKEHGIIAVGWDELGDFKQYPTKQAIAAAIRQHRGGDTKPVNDALACYQFSQEMRIGDEVFVKTGRSQILGYGTITSEHRFDPQRTEYRNVRDVEWVVTGSWQLPRDRLIGQKTLTDLTDAQDYVQYVRDLVTQAPGDSPAQVVAPATPDLYSMDHALAEFFIDKAQLETLLQAFTRKKNLILAGPPGVGKTFAARRIAYLLMGREAPSRVQMIQFHQSYAYEDFIQGWRPVQQGFARREGVFYKFCETAKEDREHSYVFVIDEINRGNLSKILGELMLLLEADKRGPDFAIPLTYADENTPPFYIPENVYVLRMMNTADRSLAMVDHALRRRFAFFEVHPAYGNPRFRTHLAQAGVPNSLIDRIVSGMQLLNADITADKDLGHGFEIGHSFFIPIGTEEQLDEEWFELIVRTEIEPLLQEYWFDNPEKVTALVNRLLS